MGLERMEQIGVMEKQTEATDWVNGMVTVQRPNVRRPSQSWMPIMDFGRYS